MIVSGALAGGIGGGVGGVAIGGWAVVGIWSASGAALGSIIPGAGTVLGVVVGGIIGMSGVIGGGLLGGEIASKFCWFLFVTNTTSSFRIASLFSMQQLSFAPDAWNIDDATTINSLL